MALHSKEYVFTDNQACRRNCCGFRWCVPGNVCVILGGGIYKLYFDGSTVLAPILHPHVDMQSLPKLSIILSRGYLCSGFLPTRVVLPALVYILLGTTVKLPPSMLLSAFADSLSSHETSKIKEALARCKRHKIFRRIKRLPNFNFE